MENSWLLDRRSQDRYTLNGDMKKLVDEKEVPQTLEKFVDAIPDLSDHTVPTVETQPALGSFDADTLARVQKSFPYNVFK